MGFKFASFGAATVPLSKIVVDNNLDMGQYRIIAKEVKAGRVYSPIRTEEWETEPLDWGDTPPTKPVNLTSPINIPMADDVELLSWTTPSGAARLWRFYLRIGVESNFNAKITFKFIDGGGNNIHTMTGIRGQTYDFYLVLEPGKTVRLISTYEYGYAASINTGSYIENTGKWYDEKTFDLTGKWLALGIDMHGLDATITVNGVNVPYADYAKYFPIAPTQLVIPKMQGTQTRPVIEVYKNV